MIRLTPIEKINRSSTSYEGAWLVRITFWAFIAALWMPVPWLYTKAAQKHNREVAALKGWRAQNGLRP